MTQTTNEAALEYQRAELHRTIWAIADERRGSVDGWDFKQYVLRMSVSGRSRPTIRRSKTGPTARSRAA